MKKLFLLLLTLVVALSVFVACSDECTAHVDENKDGICDNCEASVAPPACTNHTDTNKDFKCDNCSKDLPYTGKDLSEKVVSQLKEAKSFKIDLEVTDIEDDSYWYDNDGDITEEKEYSKTVSKLYATVSLDEDGGVAAMIELEEFYDYGEGETYTGERAPFMYLIDGIVYAYDEDLCGYVKVEIPFELAMLEETLSRLTEGVTVDEKETRELLAKLGDFAITSFNIVKNKGTISVDLKDELNAILNCFKELDVEKDTVEDLINAIIDVTGSELDAQALVAKITDTLGLTVKDAILALDAWHKESYGTTLQESYDSFIANPTVEIIIKNAMMITLENSPEPPADPVKVVNETYKTQFVDLKIENLINDPELAEITVFELALSILGVPAEEAPELAQLKEMVSGILSLTVAELESELETGIISMMKQAASGVTVDALDARLDINFKGILSLDSVNFELNLGITNKMLSSDVEGKTDVSVSKIKIAVKLYEITSKTPSIELDDADEIYPDIFNQFFSDEDNNSNYMSINCYEKEAYIEMYFDYLGYRICVTSDVIDLNELKSTTITVPGDKLYFSSEDTLVGYEPNGELSLELDLENGTYTLISMPEFERIINALEALEKLGTGEGVDNSDEYDLDTEFGGYISSLYTNEILIRLSSDYYLTHIWATGVTDETTGNLICTVKSISCSNEKPLYDLEKEYSWYGSVNEGITEYLGGAEEFIIYVDENGVIKNDGLPDVLDEFKAAE